MSWAVLGAVCLGLGIWGLMTQPERRLRAVAAPGTWRPGPTRPRPGGIDRVWRLSGSGRRAREAARLAAQLPLCLDLLAACLEAGASMRAALSAVAPVSGAETRQLLAVVAGQLELGRSGPDAWRTLAGHPSWGAAARDVARSIDSGAALVSSLRAHAGEQRRATAWERRRRARAAGVRAILPLTLCFLPAFVLVGAVPIVAGLLKGLLG